MNDHQNEYDLLDQYNYSDGGYLHKVVEKYSILIGSFLIKFSILEDQLNETIADSIHHRTHELGFVVIEKLSMSNKIDLFYKLYVRLEACGVEKNKGRLKPLAKKLSELNTFRNSIVHANWQTLTSDKFVRTKIVVDNEEGYVKFKKVEMSLRKIRIMLRETEKITEAIFNYQEEAWQSI